MVHITKAIRAENTILYVGGQLTWDEIDELADHYAAAESQVVLELSQLAAVDTEGVEVLLELASMGVELCGVSSSIQALMNTSDAARLGTEHVVLEPAV